MILIQVFVVKSNFVNKGQQGKQEVSRLVDAAVLFSVQFLCVYNFLFAFYVFGCGGDGNDEDEGNDRGPAATNEEEESEAEGIAGAGGCCCCCCCSTFSLRDG